MKNRTTTNSKAQAAAQAQAAAAAAAAQAMAAQLQEAIESNGDATCIKVIGVGGAGGNTIAHMIRKGVRGVDFIVANTDAQALTTNPAPTKIKLGDSGLGAGAKPEIGRLAAERSRLAIEQALEGADMVFIAAGMGGGTGTGGAGVVASVAKELGALTVAVVSKPFDFEGTKRMRSAEQGISDLEEHADSVIVVLNNSLIDVLGEDVTQVEAFAAVDNILNNAVAGIAEIITSPGLVNVDFQDVKTVMEQTGRAMMGSAEATGTDRAAIAARDAIACPLLEGISLSGVKGLLVNITAAPNSLKLRETREAMNVIRSYASEDAQIIMGAVFDEGMGDALRVTVVAAGIDALMDAQEQQRPGAVVGKEMVVERPPVMYARVDGTMDRAATEAAVPVQQPRVQEPAGLVASVFRTARARQPEAANARSTMDIPAFLRLKADAN